MVGSLRFLLFFRYSRLGTAEAINSELPMVIDLLLSPSEIWSLWLKDWKGGSPTETAFPGHPSAEEGYPVLTSPVTPVAQNHQVLAFPQHATPTPFFFPYPF